MKSMMTILLLAFTNIAFAQIGKTYQEVQELYGKQKPSSLKKEDGLLMEDKWVTGHEKRKVIYNADSMVVGFYASYESEGLSNTGLVELKSEELPDFSISKELTTNKATYKLDARNNDLIIIYSASTSNTFPLKGVLFMTDPQVVETFKKKIPEWEEL